MYNKVLIIRFSSLGDVILTTPLIRSLKKKYPSANIDFLVREEYKDLLTYNPYLRNIFQFERNVDNLETIYKLQDEKYDLVIDLQNNFRSKKISKWLRAYKVEFKRNDLSKFLLVKFKINLMKNLGTISERYAEVLSDFQLDDEGLDLFIPEEIQPKIKREENIIGFCPGSRHFTKQYPKDYFIQLGEQLNNVGYKIALFGGKDDRELCNEISNKIKNAIDLSTDNDILQIARDMQECKAIVCNDSGLMHIASAVKVPLIAIFGSSVKEFGFAPYKAKSIIVENESLKCRPCSHIGRESCPKKHFKCMLEIKPEIVFQNLKNFIEV